MRFRKEQTDVPGTYARPGPRLKPLPNSLSHTEESTNTHSHYTEPDYSFVLFLFYFLEILTDVTDEESYRTS